ncbi:MAG TPA: hypothetical protein DC049_05900 [Spirochaetia bacterium]|nr:hypothetical protein [Spirochaetia bacterium]
MNTLYKIFFILIFFLYLLPAQQTNKSIEEIELEILQLKKQKLELEKRLLEEEINTKKILNGKTSKKLGNVLGGGGINAGYFNLKPSRLHADAKNNLILLGGHGYGLINGRIMLGGKGYAFVNSTVKQGDIITVGAIGQIIVGPRFPVKALDIIPVVGIGAGGFTAGYLAGNENQELIKARKHYNATVFRHEKYQNFFASEGGILFNIIPGKKAAAGVYPHYIYTFGSPVQNWAVSLFLSFGHFRNE